MSMGPPEHPTSAELSERVQEHLDALTEGAYNARLVTMHNNLHELREDAKTYHDHRSIWTKRKGRKHLLSVSRDPFKRLSHSEQSSTLGEEYTDITSRLRVIEEERQQIEGDLGKTKKGLEQAYKEGMIPYAILRGDTPNREMAGEVLALHGLLYYVFNNYRAAEIYLRDFADLGAMVHDVEYLLGSLHKR